MTGRVSLPPNKAYLRCPGKAFSSKEGIISLEVMSGVLVLG